jgi:hypothetical protein
MRARGYDPTVEYINPQSAFHTMVNDFQSVKSDAGEAGNYLDKIDAKI